MSNKKHTGTKTHTGNKKHKGTGLQAVTANDLRSGKVVYLNPQFLWTNHLSKALVSDDVDLIEKMKQAAYRDDKSNLVVGVYMIDVDTTSRLPARYREKFRMQGPSYDPGKLIELGG